MKRLILIAGLALALSGCANLQTAWQVATSVSVSPTQIVVAGNSFDAAEASAAQYLGACKGAALPASACTLPIRRKIVAAVRAGRAARNALEPYVTTGAAGPATIYNTLLNSIGILQSNLPISGAKP
jgi:hypothetical protein